MQGAAVQPPGDPTQLLNLPPGTEIARVFFPRTAVNEAHEQYNLAQQLYLDGELIAVKVLERQRVSWPPYLAYLLDRNLAVQGLHVPDGIKNAYQELGNRRPGVQFDKKEHDRLQEGVVVFRSNEEVARFRP
jgi:hypothetical protein